MANKDQIIYEQRKKIQELEAQIKILKMNVSDEVKLSHSLMKKIAGQITRVTPET